MELEKQEGESGDRHTTEGFTTDMMEAINFLEEGQALDYMFKIKSYIKIPNKKITDLNEICNNPSEFFIEISNKDEIRKIRGQLDSDYLDGAIFISYEEYVLLDFRQWDLVDHLWAYMVTMVEEFLSRGKSETYFPDQPLCMEITSIGDNTLLFKLYGNDEMRQVLPKKEFISAIIKGAQYFFEKAIEHFGDIENYQYELDRINKLNKQLES